MKQKLIEAIRLFLIILFVYTATNKVLTLQYFAKGLSRFPLLSSYSKVIAYAIPEIEFVIALLLIIPRYYNYGFGLALFIMVFFTGYLGFSLSEGYNLPCSCGGVISQLNWTQHLYFNIGVLIMIVWALFSSSKERQ